MLTLLYRFLDSIKTQSIKIKLHSYLGFLVTLYVRARYFVTYTLLNDKTQRLDAGSDLIVSLTSFPPRIHLLHLTISTLLEQTVKPARIILWLADSQFPDRNALPSKLLRLRENGLEIRFCDDLKSHKKYYYTYKEFPSATIITVDDDVIYPRNTIEKLAGKSKEYPQCVCCNRGHEITFTNGKADEYQKWVKEATYLTAPTGVLCPTGVGGVLYPPGSLSPEVLNKQNIQRFALSADDLWLKLMELFQGTKAVYTDGAPQWLFLVSGTQKVTLAKNNVYSNHNDRVLADLLASYQVDLLELCRQVNTHE